ncbi:MAG: pentapeptide repeat-containing protein, partial [Myxococcales bacterium]|nr:pentapeptide repeat-containing protein [Myxococcales bacterium]
KQTSVQQSSCAKQTSLQQSGCAKQASAQQCAEQSAQQSFLQKGVKIIEINDSSSDSDSDSYSSSDDDAGLTISQCGAAQQSAQNDMGQCSQSKAVQQKFSLEQSAQAGCGATITQSNCQLLGDDVDIALLMHNGDFHHHHVHGHVWGTKHHFRWTKHKNLKLNHNCFTQSTWSKLNLSKAVINDLSWNGPMYKVNFSKGSISQSSMSGQLMGVSFQNTMITNTNFHGAHFGVAKGRKSTVISSFAGAKLDNVNFSGAFIDHRVSFKGVQIGSHVNFIGAYIVTDHGLVQVTADMATHILHGFADLAATGVGIGAFLIDGGFTVLNVAGNLVHGVLDTGVGAVHGAAHGVLNTAVNVHMTLSSFFNTHGVYTGGCGSDGMDHLHLSAHHNHDNLSSSVMW